MNYLAFIGCSQGFEVKETVFWDWPSMLHLYINMLKNHNNIRGFRVPFVYIKQMHTLYLKKLFIQHLSCISMGKNHMCIESTSLRINSQRFLVFFREETWQEKRVSEAFNAIQVQILNKLAVSQKSRYIRKKTACK